MKAYYNTRYLSEVLYNLLRLLKLIDATCFNRKRLLSVFQFLAHASIKTNKLELLNFIDYIYTLQNCLPPLLVK